MLNIHNIKDLFNYFKYNKMKTELTYYHGRNVFIRNEWKPFINRYFKDIIFLGFDCGHYGPTIEITNWEEVKNNLPKSYQPIYVNGELNELHPKYKDMKEYQNEIK